MRSTTLFVIMVLKMLVVGGERGDGDPLSEIIKLSFVFAVDIATILSARRESRCLWS